ncbi:alpha/beta fold hydrolase [Candidatus Mycolicibacterium alkanivorans]|uniref:alpha/beta fold hydrolase n=1 Tax=Candidatus Mycolicibacterium alkanivorans TaxID=2954114 RepID=UPI0027E2004D|nr:alpha/beta hydrolase [Candidatus Mycolicibacterium alkanivorans]
MINRHVTVPGATLHYEIRGEGPLLLVIGSPMGAAEFAPLAEALAGDHTVVTYDPRGHGTSATSAPDDDATPDQRADDVAAILDDLGAADADVLVAGRADRVRTLVAHEPPLLELLPDAEQQRGATDAIVDTFRAEGFGPAWHRFMVTASSNTNCGRRPGIYPTEGRCRRTTSWWGSARTPDTPSPTAPASSSPNCWGSKLRSSRETTADSSGRQPNSQTGCERS